MKRFLFYCLILLLPLSCGDRITNVEYVCGEEYGVTMILELGRNVWFFDHNNAITLAGSTGLIDSSHKDVDCGVMTIHGFDFEFVDSVFRNYGFEDADFDTLSRKPEFGTEAIWGYEGNKELDIDSFYVSFFIPERIEIISPAQGTKIKTDENLLIEWATEEDYFPDNLFFIAVHDENGFTVFQDNDFDDGECIVPHEYLAGCSKIGIFLARSIRKEYIDRNVSVYISFSDYLTVDYDVK